MQLIYHKLININAQFNYQIHFFIKFYIFLYLNPQRMIGKLQKKYLGSIIPVINIHGVIKQDMTDRVAKRLSQINTQRAVALAVSVNSPGGLPVQSEIISNKILKFARKNNLKLFTFAGDVAASGGYFILSIGDHVVSDRNSILGSIGVLVNKLILKGFLQQTSLQNKSLSSNDKLLADIFNPFNDWTEEDKQFLKQKLENTHEKFISHVKKYRSNKLANDKELFTGQIYAGDKALEKGLVDQVGSMVRILQNKFPDAKLDFPISKKKILSQIFA